MSKHSLVFSLLMPLLGWLSLCGEGGCFNLLVFTVVVKTTGDEMTVAVGENMKVCPTTVLNILVKFWLICPLELEWNRLRHF